MNLPLQDKRALVTGAQAALAADTAIVCWLDVCKDHWACIVPRSGPPVWQRLAGAGADKSWTQQDENLAQEA